MARAKKSPVPRWLWLLCFVVVSVAVVLLEPYDSDSSGAASSGGTGPSPTYSGSAALQALAMLPVRDAASQSGYERGMFGSAWTDSVTVEFGKNGCDTRNDILKRDLVHISLEPATKDCTVRTGTLHDPYTGTEIFFRRGSATSSQVQIDHVVALSNAWKTGAQQLDEQRRRDLANDPRNLIAVDGPTNQSKGDSDAAQWLPPNPGYHCDYVAQQIEVKTVYELWVTPAEHDAMSRVLAAC